MQEDYLTIKIKIIGENYGTHQGKVIINHNEIKYVIPVLVHYTEGAITANQNDDSLYFTINNLEQWSFAKISVTKSNTEKTDTITATPGRDASMKIYQNGEYWIEAKIKVNGETFDAYNTIKVESIDEEVIDHLEIIDVPEKQIGIIFGIISIIAIVGVIKRRSVMHEI